MAAFETALRLTLAAMHDQPVDVRAELERLRDLADAYRLGPSTQAIVDAALDRGIPVLRLTPTSSLVQLGWGVHQRRIRAAGTSNTSAIACDLCQAKPLTNGLLRDVGLPVPRGRPVKSADEAWQVAQELGLPVVVKPSAGNQGKGVTVDLGTEAGVRAAYDLALEVDRGDVLVEAHVQGDDYRLLVVNGALVAAARRDPAHVVGDGRRTVAELVAEANRDPRRREGHVSSLTRIRLDAATDLVLQQQRLTRDDVPPAGQRVRLRSNGNLSTGGTAADVTDDVHPRNARLAVLAVQVLGMDIAGIDVICRDIRRPLREQRGAIVEVNAAPGLRMHLSPTDGRRRDVGTPIIDMLYPRSQDGRIPIIAVTGTNGKTTTTRLIAHTYETARYVVGMTCTDGTYIDGERILRGDCSGPKSARAVLLHPSVEVAVLETARGGILREGLAFDACTVGVVTNVTPDHLGISGIETLEDLAKVKQVVVENVRRDGAAVLNADDPVAAEMAAASDARVVYFSANPRNPIVTAHINAGCPCVLAEDGWIVLVDGRQRTPLIALERVGFTAAGRIPFQVQNALAATAAAWAAGLNPVMIARALATFETDTKTAPGRFNRTVLNGVEVIFDYGHNAGGMRALAEAVGALGARRTVVTLGLPGDRRDDDLVATVRAIAPVADALVLYDQHDRRGRAQGEVPDLLRRHLPEEADVAVAGDQAAGITEAWHRARPGDRLIVIADEVDEGIELVHALSASAAEEGACTTPVGDSAGRLDVPARRAAA